MEDPSNVLRTTPVPGESGQASHIGGPKSGGGVRVVLLVVTLALVLIVGLGFVLPGVFVSLEDATRVKRDQIRQALAEDFFSESVSMVSSVPTGVVWTPYPAKEFSVKEHPIFQDFGYNQSFMLERNNMDKLYAIPNVSSSLYAASTAGKVWSTQGGKLASDPAKGYEVSSIMVFDDSLSFFRVMPLPKRADGCCPPVIAWFGNRYIVANEFIPGVYPPGAGNYFYVGDTASSAASRTFEVIPIPESLTSKRHLDLNVFSHPDKNLAALLYCLTSVDDISGMYCSQYGVSVASPQRIVEVMRRNTENSFKVGWDESHLYVQETDNQVGNVTTYRFPISEYEDDQFISSLSQHRDPAAKGEPVWAKMEVPITTKANLLQMDIDFTSTSTYAAYSRAFFTVSLNGKPVGVAYEEQEPKGLHAKTVYFPELPLGTSTLEFRIDPLSFVRSPVRIENVRFGYIDFEEK